VFVEAAVLDETDGAALADAVVAAAGVVLAVVVGGVALAAGVVAAVPAADGAAVVLGIVAVAGVALAVVVVGVALAVVVVGVVLAVVVGGVVLAGVVAAADAAGVAEVVAVAGVAIVLVVADFLFVVAGVALVVAVAGDVLGDVMALAAGDFISLLRDDFSFFSVGVALMAGSVEVFVSGTVAGTFRVFGAFFSGFIAAGDSVAVGSFTAGASVFGFTTGASVFGARVCVGFTSAGAFFSWLGFVPGDCSSLGVGCWAITAPASARETTISKLIIFFMVAEFWSVDGGDLFNAGGFPARNASHSDAGRCPDWSVDRLTTIVRASLSVRSCPAIFHFSL